VRVLIFGDSKGIGLETTRQALDAGYDENALAWSPTAIGPVDEMANTAEFFVHHEDVRRAAPDWEPRALDPAFEAVLTRLVGRLKLLVRRSPVGVRFCTPDGTVRLERRGDDLVTVTGPASELVLYAYGRQRHSKVELSGDDRGTRALQDASLGL